MKIAFIILFSFLLGFIVYKLIPFKYTNNTKAIISNLLSELKGLNNSLLNKNVEKTDLLKRKNEILLILEKFYGKKINYDEVF